MLTGRSLYEITINLKNNDEITFRLKADNKIDAAFLAGLRLSENSPKAEDIYSIFINLI
jgi:hypothetical protein